MPHVCSSAAHSQSGRRAGGDHQGRRLKTQIRRGAGEHLVRIGKSERLPQTVPFGQNVFSGLLRPSWKGLTLMTVTDEKAHGAEREAVESLVPLVA